MVKMVTESVSLSKILVVTEQEEHVKEEEAPSDHGRV